jgi:hypothetical protein
MIAIHRDVHGVGPASEPCRILYKVLFGALPLTGWSCGGFYSNSEHRVPAPCLFPAFAGFLNGRDIIDGATAQNRKSAGQRALLLLCNICKECFSKTIFNLPGHAEKVMIWVSVTGGLGAQQRGAA